MPAGRPSDGESGFVVVEIKSGRRSSEALKKSRKGGEDGWADGIMSYPETRLGWG
jgi:hypothetical protein